MKCGFKKYQKHKGVGGGDDPQLTPYTYKILYASKVSIPDDFHCVRTHFEFLEI